MIPAQPHTFTEIGHEIFAAFIFIFPLIQDGLLSVTSESMRAGYWLTASCKLAHEKSMVRLIDTFDMLIAVDRDIKSQTKMNKKIHI